MRWIFSQLPPTSGRPLSVEHGLAPDEIEAAFERVFALHRRDDGSYQMFAETPSDRSIWVIWRYDPEDDDVPDILSDLEDLPIFVITAY